MPHYICNPDLNTECKKNRCHYNHTGPCFATSNPLFSTNKDLTLDSDYIYHFFEDKFSNITVQ